MLPLEAYDFPLPDEQIARFPTSPRDHSRLLYARRKSTERQHLRFSELGNLLRPGDCLVLNETKVLKARLFGQGRGGRRFELLLLSPTKQPHVWDCLIKPGRHVEPEGTELSLPEGLSALLRRRDDRRFEVQFPSLSVTDFYAWLERNGAVPLPPYLKREAEAQDSETYQTVYASQPGSVAAPTAGLHFTPALLESLQSQGVRVEKVTLHIGYGTFAPLDPSATELHPEPFTIDAGTWARLEQVRANGGRVIAVGTTSLRALESATADCLSGTTRLFIQPGYAFKHTDGLITNFHLPRSSLFILVSAFLGPETTKDCYLEAVAEKYRFYSYGDAMAIL